MGELDVHLQVVHPRRNLRHGHRVEPVDGGLSDRRTMALKPLEALIIDLEHRVIDIVGDDLIRPANEIVLAREGQHPVVPVRNVLLHDQPLLKQELHRRVQVFVDAKALGEEAVLVQARGVGHGRPSKELLDVDAREDLAHSLVVVSPWRPPRQRLRGRLVEVPSCRD